MRFGSAARPLPSFFSSLLDRLPSQCAVCRAWPSQPVCDACVARFAPPTPRCTTCALPVPAGVARCGDCVRHPPPLDACLAACTYAWPWPGTIGEFKFQGQAGWAAPFATLMRSMPWAEPAVEQADLVLPMPLSTARLRQRGFNQAFELARRLAPVDGDAARVEEVTNELHRSDAPLQLANGKLDLMSFQNRFPQVQIGTRLLRKVPRTAGSPGFELTGIPILAEIGKDLDLAVYAADGTGIDVVPAGEFLIARRDGFLNVDPKSSRIAISDKIVSHDGVSARTTGNLHLSGDYEEFGEVQEQRIIEGDSITVHADVYGHVLSRGGAVRLECNLVGGSARNLNGGVRVLGVASSATIQAARGDVILGRAENCVISGARIRVETAINCEIMGDDVEVAHAEGSAIAGRRVKIGSAAPWKQGEMLVYLLRPDCARIDDAMAQVRERIGQFGQLAARHRASIDTLAAQPHLSKYLKIAPRIRSGDLVLKPEQVPQFQRMTDTAGPALKELGRLSDEANKLDAERQSGMEVLGRLEAQRYDRVGAAQIMLEAIAGEVQVRALPYEPDLGCIWDQGPRDIRLRLRDAMGTELLHAGRDGAWAWDSTSPTALG